MLRLEPSLFPHSCCICLPHCDVKFNGSIYVCSNTMSPNLSCKLSFLSICMCVWEGWVESLNLLLWNSPVRFNRISADFAQSKDSLSGFVVFIIFHFGEGNGNPLHYSCLENPMDGEAWWATVHGVAKSRTWLSNFTFNLPFRELIFKFLIKGEKTVLLHKMTVVSDKTVLSLKPFHGSTMLPGMAC